GSEPGPGCAAGRQSLRHSAQPGLHLRHAGPPRTGAPRARREPGVALPPTGTRGSKAHGWGERGPEPNSRRKGIHARVAEPPGVPQGRQGAVTHTRAERDQIQADALAIGELAEEVPVVAFVNNHFEGCAPQTVAQLLAALEGAGTAGRC